MVFYCTNLISAIERSRDPAGAELGLEYFRKNPCVGGGSSSITMTSLSAAVGRNGAAGFVALFELKKLVIGRLEQLDFTILVWEFS